MPKQDRPVSTGPRCSLCAKESTGLDELFGDPLVCCGTPSLGVGRLSAAFPRDGPPTPEKELSTDGGLILRYRTENGVDGVDHGEHAFPGEPVLA